MLIAAHCRSDPWPRSFSSGQPIAAMGRSYGEARNGDRCASTFACLSTSADSFAHHSRRAEANVGSAIQWRLRTGVGRRSEEHTSELQSLMRQPYAVFCLKETNNTNTT